MSDPNHEDPSRCDCRRGLPDRCRRVLLPAGADDGGCPSGRILVAEPHLDTIAHAVHHPHSDGDRGTRTTSTTRAGLHGRRAHLREHRPSGEWPAITRRRWHARFGRPELRGADRGARLTEPLEPHAGILDVGGEHRLGVCDGSRCDGRMDGVRWAPGQHPQREFQCHGHRVRCRRQLVVPAVRGMRSHVLRCGRREHNAHRMMQ